MNKKSGYIGNRNSYKHGGSFTRLYKIWAGIKSRCLNSKSNNYFNYGGRGITICNKWLEFIPFMKWALNNGYQEGLEIDRIDNNGNYAPDNCRWVTIKESNRNKRNVKLSLNKANEIRELYKTNGYSQEDLAIKYNISRRNISFIINNKRWI